MRETAEEPNEFEVFESAAEIFGFVWNRCGATGLRRLLKLSGGYRESLQQAADELEAVGLGKAAMIVTEAAADAPPRPYTHMNWHERVRARQTKAH